MKFCVKLVRNYEEMGTWAGNWMVERLNKSGVRTVGLATGSTPVGMYEYLVEHHHEFEVNNLVSFNLDEYVGLPGVSPEARREHRESYEFFMRHKLFDRLQPGFKEWKLPGGVLVDQGRLLVAMEEGGWEWLGRSKGKAVKIGLETGGYLGWIRDKVVDEYVREIDAKGGIDVQVLGVGEDGHVGFHEAGIGLDEKMLLVKLDESTVVNAVADGHFDSTAVAPKYAVSMGVGLIFKAGAVLLLASGARKARVMKQLLAGGFDEELPVSEIWRYVERGGEVCVVMDEAAGEGALESLSALESKGVVVEDLR